MDVSSSYDSAAQYGSVLKTAAGYDAFTKTNEKTEQMKENEQMRLEIAEQTGKGVNLDVTA
jgi:hypothetical protein